MGLVFSDFPGSEIRIGEDGTREPVIQRRGGTNNGAKYDTTNLGTPAHNTGRSTEPAAVQYSTLRCCYVIPDDSQSF